MKTKKDSLSTRSLLESEKEWGRGKSADPMVSREVAAHFLRAYRGRSDLARAVSATEGHLFSERLEVARNLIMSGSLNEAENTLGPPEGLSSSELGEYYLELARIRLLSRDPGNAEQAVSRALQEPELSEVSRLTCYQLAADAALQQKQPERAIESLKLAISIAEVFSVVPSAFSARAHLVKAYAELGRVGDAEQEYRLLLAMLEQLADDELWLDRRLTALRAECQLARLTHRKDDWRLAASEGVEIARWIGDEPCRANCESELAELSRTDGHLKSASSVERFLGWTYLPRLKVILHESPRAVMRLDGRPVAEKILKTLLRGPLAKDRLFEEVWGISFHSERHSPHLMAILSKVRKLLPAGSLLVQEGVVELKR